MASMSELRPSALMPTLFEYRPYPSLAAAMTTLKTKIPPRTRLISRGRLPTRVGPRSGAPSLRNRIGLLADDRSSGIDAMPPIPRDSIPTDPGPSRNGEARRLLEVRSILPGQVDRTDR